jgi:hypothetical protein
MPESISHTVLDEHGPHHDSASLMPHRLVQALHLLAEAAGYADQTSGDRWEFAIEIRHLRELGLLDSDLRYLVKLQYVEHASEVTTAGKRDRQFKHVGQLPFNDQTCFVLSNAGIAASGGEIGSSPQTDAFLSPIIGSTHTSVDFDCPDAPSWDSNRRILALGTYVVKHFKRRALNQELILSVFQEEGWPPRIDDPLAPSPTVDIKRRLSDTIKSLNRKQENKLICFHGDGTGQGVLWESAASSIDAISQ